MMLDKSSEQILDNNLMYIQKEFEQNAPNIVLCSESYHKIEFLNRLINSVKNSIIFIDIDLLYTGYVESAMIQKKNNVTVFHPNKTNWKKELSKIIVKISKEKFLVVIDSFNGIYNMFDDHLESSRFINSCIMLLAAIGKQANCTIVVTAMTRKKETSEWISSPGGKQFIKLGKTGIYFLKKIENDLVISTVEGTDLNSKIFTIIQENN